MHPIIPMFPSYIAQPTTFFLALKRGRVRRLCSGLIMQWISQIMHVHMDRRKKSSPNYNVELGNFVQLILALANRFEDISADARAPGRQGCICTALFQKGAFDLLLLHNVSSDAFQIPQRCGKLKAGELAAFDPQFFSVHNHQAKVHPTVCCTYTLQDSQSQSVVI